MFETIINYFEYLFRYIITAIQMLFLPWAFFLGLFRLIMLFLPPVLFSINFFARTKEKRSTSITVSVLITVLILIIGGSIGASLGGFEAAGIMMMIVVPLVIGCSVSLIAGAAISSTRKDSKPKPWLSIICIFVAFILWSVFLNNL